MASCFFDSLQYDLHTSVHVSLVLCLFTFKLVVCKLICLSTSLLDASLKLILRQIIKVVSCYCCCSTC